MGMEKLQEFFFWCMLLNVGIYTLTAISVLVLRDFVCKMLCKMFRIDEEAVRKSIQMYLGCLQVINYRFQLCAMDCSIDYQLRTPSTTTIAYLIMHLFKGRASALSFSFRKHLDILYRAFTSMKFYVIKKVHKAGYEICDTGCGQK